MASSVSKVIDEITDSTIGIAVLVLLAVVIIILMAKLKDTSAIASINESKINSTIDTGIDVAALPVELSEILIVVVVLVGILAVVLTVFGKRDTKIGNF